MSEIETGLPLSVNFVPPFSKLNVPGTKLIMGIIIGPAWSYNVKWVSFDFSYHEKKGGEKTGVFIRINISSMSCRKSLFFERFDSWEINPIMKGLSSLIRNERHCLSIRWSTPGVLVYILQLIATYATKLCQNSANKVWRVCRQLGLYFLQDLSI